MPCILAQQRCPSVCPVPPLRTERDDFRFSLCITARHLLLHLLGNSNVDKNIHKNQAPEIMWTRNGVFSVIFNYAMWLYDCEQSLILIAERPFPLYCCTFAHLGFSVVGEKKGMLCPDKPKKRFLFISRRLLIRNKTSSLLKWVVWLFTMHSRFPHLIFLQKRINIRPWSDGYRTSAFTPLRNINE